MPKTWINRLCKSCLLFLFASPLLGQPAVVSAEVELHEPDLTMNVWPGEVPGETVDQPEIRTADRGDGIVRFTNVSTPTINVFKAEGAKEPTPAVVVCPGGGYGILAYNIEGTEIVKWLNSIGVTGVILKYRVPKNRMGAFQDAQRAMRLVRAHAKEWNIDPSRVGIMGFSAGGHLSARLSTGYNEDIYEKVDKADDLSCRPDFTILIYPAYLSKDDFQVPEEINVTNETPSAFIVQTQDDPYGASAIAYYLALRKAKVFSELHLYPHGGHGYGLGYGLRPAKDANMDWPALAEKWLEGLDVLKKAEEEREDREDK